jgi:hypothetical protein
MVGLAKEVILFVKFMLCIKLGKMVYGFQDNDEGIGGIRNSISG